MAANEVTGATPEGLEELKEEFLDTKRGQSGVPFDDAFCLTKIQRQPEDYDGPVRYCQRWTCKDRTDFCPHHEHYENLETLAAMKHGVKAMREHLKADFNEREQEAYDRVVEEWADYYGIEDPSSMDTLESLAVEIVREVRADKVIEDEGMKKFRTVYGPNGEREEEDEAHYLLEERRAIRNLIQKLKRDLGITRKHRQKMEVEEDKASHLDALSEQVSDSIEGGDYEPEIPDNED